MDQSPPPPAATPVRTPGWFPDPARGHELRSFDGASWTEQVADAGRVTQAPLGPPPPGLLGWFAPEVMLRSAVPTGHVDVPRVKMWVLAALSLFVFSIHTPGTNIALPVGVVVAIWCWRATATAWSSRIRLTASLRLEIEAARIMAVCFALVCILQCVVRMR